jgi:hypothetical protein
MFYGHQKKTLSSFIDLIPDSFPVGSRIATSTRFAPEYVSLQEDLRKISLYVDYLAEKQTWVSPLLIKREEASGIVESAEKAVQRLSAIRDTGIFAEKALQIQHEETCFLTENLLKNGQLDLGEARKIAGAAPEAVRRYFCRLLKEADVRFPDDMKINGVNWREFVGIPGTGEKA